MTSATIVFHLTRQNQGQAELADFAETLMMRFDSRCLMKDAVHIVHAAMLQLQRKQ